MVIFKKKRNDAANDNDVIDPDLFSDMIPKSVDAPRDKVRDGIQARLGVDKNFDLMNAHRQRESLGLTNPFDENTEEAKQQQLVDDVTLVTEMTPTERRIQYEAIARIERLMFQLRSNPDNIDDFLNFAKESSNTESSIAFMESLYYYTQSNKDTKVIVELARLSAREMFSLVDEIIRFKIKRVENVPMVMMMTMLIPIFGIVITFLITTAINAFSGF